MKNEQDATLKELLAEFEGDFDALGEDLEEIERDFKRRLAAMARECNVTWKALDSALAQCMHLLQELTNLEDLMRNELRAEVCECQLKRDVTSTSRHEK